MTAFAMNYVKSDNNMLPLLKRIHIPVTMTQADSDTSLLSHFVGRCYLQDATQRSADKAV